MLANKTESLANTRNNSHNQITIGQENDHFEQEADQIADQVVMSPNITAETIQMSGNDTFTPFASTFSNSASDLQMKCEACEEEEELADQTSTNTLIMAGGGETDDNSNHQEKEKGSLGSAIVQRKCKSCEEQGKVQMKSYCASNHIGRTQTPKVQMKCEACNRKEGVQLKASNRFSSTKTNDQSYIDDRLSSQVRNAASGGMFLDPYVELEMSQKIGADFSDVRIHTDYQAVYLNKQLGARAFTIGNHIFFGQGEYHPGTTKGQHLLAHELVHTVQQGDKFVQKQSQTVTPETSSNEVYIIVYDSGIYVLVNGVAKEILHANLGWGNLRISPLGLMPFGKIDPFLDYYDVNPGNCSEGILMGDKDYAGHSIEIYIGDTNYQQIKPYLTGSVGLYLRKSIGDVEDLIEGSVEQHIQIDEEPGLNTPTEDDSQTDLSTISDSNGSGNGLIPEQHKMVADVFSAIDQLINSGSLTGNGHFDDQSLDEVTRLSKLMNRELWDKKNANTNRTKSAQNTVLEYVINSGLNKYLAGKTIDPTLPWMSTLAALLNEKLKVKRELFHALIYGASMKNESIGELYGGLIDAMIEAQKIKLDWDTLSSLIPYFGPLKKLNKLYGIAEVIESIYELSDKIDDIRSNLSTLGDVYHDIEQYKKIAKQLEEEKTDDFQKINELENAKEVLLDIILKKVNDQASDLLDVFHIPPDSSPEDIEELILNIPAGMKSFQEMLNYYDQVDNGEYQLRDKMQGKAAETGYLLFPLVGFLLSAMTEKVNASGGFGWWGQKSRKRSKRKKGSPTLLDKKGKYKKGLLESDLKKIEVYIKKDITEDKEAEKQKEMEVQGSKVFFIDNKSFRKTVKKTIKKFNSKERKKYKAEREGSSRKLDFPRIKLLAWNVKKDGELSVEVKANPSFILSFLKFELKDIYGKAYTNGGDEGIWKMWLSINHYVETLGINNSGTVDDTKTQLRLDGKKIKPGFIHLNSKGEIAKGIPIDGYEDFLNKYINNSNDLPEGYYLQGDTVRMKHGGKTMNLVELSLDKVRTLRIALSYESFNGQGLLYEKRRKDEINLWLENNNYEYSEHSTIKNHLRLKDGGTAPGYLRFRVNKILQGIDTEAYRHFLNTVIERSSQLPEGYVLKRSDLVIKKNKGTDRLPQLELNEDKKLRLKQGIRDIIGHQYRSAAQSDKDHMKEILTENGYIILSDAHNLEHIRRVNKNKQFLYIDSTGKIKNGVANKVIIKQFIGKRITRDIDLPEGYKLTVAGDDLFKLKNEIFKEYPDDLILDDEGKLAEIPPLNLDQLKDIVGTNYKNQKVAQKSAIKSLLKEHKYIFTKDLEGKEYIRNRSDTGDYFLHIDNSGIIREGVLPKSIISEFFGKRMADYGNRSSDKLPEGYFFEKRTKVFKKKEHAVFTSYPIPETDIFLENDVLISKDQKDVIQGLVNSVPNYVSQAQEEINLERNTNLNSIPNIAIPDFLKQIQLGKGLAYGQRMEVDPITIKGKRGQAADAAAAHPHWEVLRKKYNNNGGDYVRGHLLNENLHGQALWKNLIPFTSNANSVHKHGIEKQIKKAVNEKMVSVSYVISADYDGGKDSRITRAIRLLTQLIEEINNPDTSLTQDQAILIGQIIYAEISLPDSMVCEAELLDPYDGSTKEWGSNNKILLPVKLDERAEYDDIKDDYKLKK